MVTAPNPGFRTKDGFGVENVGVPPMWKWSSGRRT
jgi:hypothetical protein